MKEKRTKIYEKGRLRNGLESILIIYKRPKDLLKASYLVPKWMVFLYLLTIVLIFTTLLSAILILCLAPRPANYQENCEGRSCAKDGNMKCIKNICFCTSDQYYSNKCYEKKSYFEKCIYSYQCKDYLSCIAGLCQCNQTHYYSNNNCINRKSYLEICNGDQCLANSLMYCNTAIGKCDCPKTRFIDNNVCVLKRWGNERCLNNNQCDETKSLICLNNICSCITTEYFDTTLLDCIPRTLNNTSCVTSYSCRVDLGLTCRSNLCLCSDVDYWNNVTNKCEPRTGYYSNCSISYTCFLNLTCTDGLCICPSTQAYNTNLQICVNCRTGWYGYDDRCYYLVYSADTWNNAKAYCESISSWLNVPSSMREIAMTNKKFSGGIWVGLYTTNPNTNCDNPFYSITTLDAVFFFWAPNQPNCIADSQFCVFQVKANMGLNDFACSTAYEYCCEYGMYF